MNTEITEQCKEWAFYDAECRFCRDTAERFRARLLKRGVGLAPLQADWEAHRDTSSDDLGGMSPSLPRSGGEGWGKEAFIAKAHGLAGEINTSFSVSLPTHGSRGEREDATPPAVAGCAANRARKLLGFAPGELPEEMKLITKDGKILGGADAVIYLVRYFWWGWGLRLVAHLPGARFVLRRAYAQLARHRYCLKGKCKL